MTEETEALVQRWILAFCEIPIIIDPTLMRLVLDGPDAMNRRADMTGKTFKAGDTVEWEHSQGTTRGKVVRKLTKPASIKGHKVAASPDNPEYLVESDKTGARAAHKPDALHKA